MGLGKASSMQILKLLAPAIAEVLKKNPQILMSSPSPGPRPLCPLGVIL